jgi:hypothetical protein
MTREQEISVIARELEKHPAFAGDFIKAAVWATRIWEALHPFDGAELLPK